MSISVKELKELDENVYQVIDVRNPIEVAHGSIPGAVAVTPEEIESSAK